MITTVIFDMDGVIVDSEPTHQRLEFEMYEELGLYISPEEHKDYVGTSSVDMWTLIKERHGLAKTPEELLMYGRGKFWKELENGVFPLVRGSRELIADLHNAGMILQVASSATRPTVDKVIGHFQLDAYFSYKIGGNEVSKSKPSPEIFNAAAKQSSSAPNCCLVIEDSSNGIKAAKAAGMHCIGYVNPSTGKQDLSEADEIVDSLTQLSATFIRNFDRR